MKEITTSEQFSFKHLPQRATNILTNLEEDGSKGKLTSFTVKDDPILMEADRQYLEARRLKQYMSALQNTYTLHGIIHSILMGCQIIGLLAILVISVTYLDISCASLACFNVYLFIMFPCSVAGLILSSVGLFILFTSYCPRCCGRQGCVDTSVLLLYNMYKGMLIMHLFFFLLYFGLTAVCAALSFHYFELSDDLVELVDEKTLNICSIILSSTGLSFTFFHTLLFLISACVKSKCNARRYCLEWVFFDYLYCKSME